MGKFIFLPIRLEFLVEMMLQSIVHTDGLLDH